MYNVNNYSNRSTTGLVWLNFSVQTKNRITFQIDEQISVEHTKRHDYLYHPDTLMLPSEREALYQITDFSNSYNSRYNETKYATAFNLFKQKVLPASELMPVPTAYRLWDISLKAIPYQRTLHYVRGDLDANVNSTDFVFNPRVGMTIYPKQKFNDLVAFSVEHYATPASLYDRVDYLDDGQPLVIKLGNPDLKGTETTRANIKYYGRGAFQRLLHVEATWIYMHRATAQSVVYDPSSGVYTYRPVNVKGNYYAKLDVDITRSFGSDRSWTWSNSANGTFFHNVDQSMLQGETESHINVVNNLSLHDGLYLQFEKNGLNLRASGDIQWRHTAGRMHDFSTLDAFDFHYGLSARYTIPAVKTTISADGTMYSRRGYGAPSLNTNDFILNASISQPLLKNKLIARIEAFDLLHQLSQTQYEVNAQGRIETWYRSLPHYVMLHLIYQFNLNAKSK